MSDPQSLPRRVIRSILRPSNIPAAVVIVALLVALVFAENQQHQLFREQSRAFVLDHVGLVRARLEGLVGSNVQLVRGLVAGLSTEPDMDDVELQGFVAHLMGEESQLRHIAVAPDLVVRMVYPLKGNEKALGLDYRNTPDQRDAALRARDTGDMVLAGPVDLVQGGQGLIARFPVYRYDQPGRRSFWGIVAAVIDLKKLYAASGLDSDEHVNFALVGKDGLGAKGDLFYGDPKILQNDPVSAEVKLPGGSWQIAAVPVGGWQSHDDKAWLVGLCIMAAGLFVLIPAVVTSRLFEERQSHIDQLASREADLARVSQRLELALDASKVGVWECDIETGELHWDDRMNELYGLNPGEQRSYEDWANALHRQDKERAEADFDQAIATKTRYDSNFRVVLKDGSIRHLRAIGGIFEQPGQSFKIVGANWDVTADMLRNLDLRRAKELAEAHNAELEKAKAQIEHSALHDALTGLPNRRFLDRCLAEAAARTKEGAGGLALLHIDLDRFKQINDTLGHAAGDATLVHAAKVLKSNVRRDDVVARIGGDEFVIVCMPGAGHVDLASLAARIVNRMRQPITHEGHECRCGVSVGIATCLGGEVDPRQLLVNADIALYKAKSRGRNRYEFFNAALQAEIVNTKRLADEILKGLETGQFEPYYQPQFDAENLDIVGMEALVRWNHPCEGLLTPDQFLDVAEDLNVVASIDGLVLKRALADFRQWQEQGFGVPRLSVNVSARRLNDEDLLSGLRSLDIPKGVLSFELVESIFLDESEEVVAFNLDQIRELGIDIEVDDFGTGHASIVSLLQLRPSKLKIDRQLVMPMIASPHRRKLVETIIDIGRNLDIKVVAEGVETMEHARMLRSFGCHALQGYAFAKPMAAREFAHFARSQAWRSAS